MTQQDLTIQIHFGPFLFSGVQSQIESYQRLKKMVLDAALLNTQHYKCYITYDIDFRFVPCDPCALTSCHVVISKQGWQCIEAGRSSRCVTVRRPHDMRTTRSDSDRVQRIESRARDTQPIRVVSDDTACNGVQVLAPPSSRMKIWDKKKSPLGVYVSPSISQTNNKLWNPFENKMRDIFLYICVPRCS